MQTKASGGFHSCCTCGFSCCYTCAIASRLSQLLQHVTSSRRHMNMSTFLTTPVLTTERLLTERLSTGRPPTG
eukprot:198714-Chlamydomonas_euryale.AAC.2